MSYDSCEAKPAGKGVDTSGGAYLRWHAAGDWAGPSSGQGRLAWAADGRGARLVWVVLLPHGDGFLGDEGCSLSRRIVGPQREVLRGRGRGRVSLNLCGLGSWRRTRHGDGAAAAHAIGAGDQLAVPRLAILDV